MTCTSRTLLPSFAAAAMLLLCGCLAQPTRAQPRTRVEPALSVATAEAKARRLPRNLELIGTLIANRESDVAADASGKIAWIGVERGDRVRKGDALARIDAREAALLEQESRAQVESARTRARLAQTECERATRLHKLGAIDRAEYDRTRAQCDAAVLEIDAAVARQRIASKAVADVVVRAPFDGVVAERFVNAGEYVRPDSRVAALVQLDPLRLELAVPEDAVARFSVGAEVEFQVAAFANETFSGRVRFIGAAVRRATRDLVVEAAVENPSERLRPGIFAHAAVALGEVVLPVIPRSALRSDERAGTDRVFVVADGRLEERLVQAEPASDGAVAVRDGLREGERVVLLPAADLRDGLRVQ